MYTALYREWRPKVFEDLIGQDHIVRTLKNQIVSGRIPHAYLFCGTRGTGKTSTAKILARAVNCLNPHEGDPCNECENCREINAGTFIDVVEIDAASKSRVENIRDVIEDVKYPPRKGAFKVYIIDEVHMLSISAFNALLKTLEEPPSHVIFILATTDPQKIPATIISRCQRYDVKRIRPEDAFKRLRRIVSENGIYAEDKTLKEIAKISDGAMRDALSILDQCMSMSEGKIEYSDVVSVLGLSSNEKLFELVDALIDKEVEKAIALIDDIIYGGRDILQFIKDMTKHLRNLLMVKIAKRPEDVVDAGEEMIGLYKSQAQKMRSEEILRSINLFIEAENEAKTTFQPRIVLEMTVIRLCRREFDFSPEMVISRINQLEERLQSGEYNIAPAQERKIPEGKQVKREAPKANETKSEEIEGLEQTSDKVDISADEARTVWQDVLSFLNANKNKVVATLLSQGEIKETKGSIITVCFDESHGINRTVLSDSHKKKIAEEAFGKVLGKPVRLDFRVIREEVNMDRSIEMAKEIFGDDLVEVIE